MVSGVIRLRTNAGGRQKRAARIGNSRAERNDPVQSRAAADEPPEDHRQGTEAAKDEQPAERLGGRERSARRPP